MPVVPFAWIALRGVGVTLLREQSEEEHDEYDNQRHPNDGNVR